MKLVQNLYLKPLPSLCSSLLQYQSYLMDGGITRMDLRGQALIFLDVSSLSMNYG